MDKRVSPKPAKSWYTHPDYTGRPAIRISPLWTVLSVIWHLFLLGLIIIRIFGINPLEWLYR